MAMCVMYKIRLDIICYVYVLFKGQSLVVLDYISFPRIERDLLHWPKFSLLSGIQNPPALNVCFWLNFFFHGK